MRRAGLTWNGDPRVKPPFGAAEINWGHPLALGLLECILANSGAGPLRGMVRPVSSSVTPSWEARPQGLTARSPWSVSAADTAYLNLTSAPWSVAAMLYLSSFVNQAVITLFGRYTYTDETNNQGWAIFRYSDTVLGTFVMNNNGSAAYRKDFTLASARPSVLLGFSLSSSSRRLYVDGRLDGELTTGNTQAASASAVLEGESPAGEIHGLYVGYVWQRELSAIDWQWLAIEPYAFLQPVVRRRYFVVAAGGATWPGWVSSRGGWI